MENMTIQDVVSYLRTWAALNAQSVYGSGSEFLSIHSLNSQLDKIQESHNARDDF